MFINELSKNEAVAFVSLVKKLADIDFMLTIEEDKLIDDYMEELNIGNEKIEFLELKDALAELKNSSARVKNIIYFELLGVALVDGDFDVEEIAFINRISKEFNISESTQSKCVDYFREMKKAYDNLGDDYEKEVEQLKIKALEIVQ